MITENFMLPREAVKEALAKVINNQNLSIISSDNISGLTRIKTSKQSAFRCQEVHVIITSGNFRQTKVKISCLKLVLGLSIPFSSFATEEIKFMDELKTQIHKV